MKSLMRKSVVGGFVACCAMSPFLCPVGADDDDAAGPAWRWEEPRDNDDWNRDGREDDWDRDRDGRRVWLSGVVTRGFIGDRFELRSNDGLVYRVIPDAGGERFPVRVGDRVRVRGTIDGNVFLAQRVEAERGYRDDTDGRDDGGWRDDRRDEDGRREVNFPATVESRESSFRLTVRGDNGRLYLIESRTSLPRQITTGSRVRVQGSALRNQVRLDRIVTISDGGQGEQFVNFRGTVERVEDFNRLRVRADNGRVYTVRAQGVLDVEQGDRVRVRGNYARGLITATRIERV